MIGILGIRRVIALSVLLVISVAMGFLLYFYILPENAKVERDLRVVRASVSSARAELEKLQNDMEFFQEQKVSMTIWSRSDFSAVRTVLMRGGVSRRSRMKVISCICTTI